MTLPNLYSRRKRKENAQAIDVYSYDDFPRKLRVQLLHVIRDAIGEYYSGGRENRSARYYESIARVMRRELGVFQLYPIYDGDVSVELFQWFLSADDVDAMLDFVELSCRLVEAQDLSRVAIPELNARFSEAAVGYAYEGGRIMRIDSEVAHAEIVLPALKLLLSPQYAAANDEYRAAHEAYRHHDFEVAVVECGKAFESVLKVIGAKRGWDISANDPAKKLLDAAYSSGFVEPALQAEFTALRSLLESSVPTIRNKKGGHGAGTATRMVPEHLAALQLHQTAAAILFLVRHDVATALQS